MQKIYIHLGLHKTGTTALQVMLFNNRLNLLNQGFYYPANGIVGIFCGHHNIAWQLSRDRRFRPEYGDLKALLNEIKNINKNNFIISSEDFECSLLHPNRFTKLIKYFLEADIHVCFVLYLRSHIGYLNSLYPELLKVGYGGEFNTFAKEFISTKKFNFKEWQFILDYTAIFKSLETIKDAEVIYRDYDNLIEKNIASDFCEVVGIDYKKFKKPQKTGRINERLPLNGLLKLFIRNRAGVLQDDISDIVDELVAGQNYNLMPSVNIRKTLADFSDKNTFYKKNDVSSHQDVVPEYLSIERAFSFETCNLIFSLKRLDQNLSRKKLLIDEWRQWVRVSS